MVGIKGRPAVSLPGAGVRGRPLAWASTGHWASSFPSIECSSCQWCPFIKK